MNKEIFLVVAIFLLLTCCADKVKTRDQVENKSKESVSFQNVYDSLDNISIPITLTPDSWDSLYSIHRDKYGIIEGWELMKHPYMKLVDSQNYKAVIFISTDETGSPTLITIDKLNSPIDTLFLLGDWGGNDPSIGTREIATINNDLTIALLDSTSTFDLGADGDRIETTEKLVVKNELYKILSNGRIQKIR